MISSRRPGLSAGRRRTLTGLLVLALVPVLVMTSGGTASAVVLYGESEPASVALRIGGPSNDVTCTLAGYFVQDTEENFPTIEVAGTCNRQIFAAQEDLWLTAAGGNCSFTSDWENDDEGDWTMTMTMDFSSWVGYLANPAGCQILGGEAHFTRHNDPSNPSAEGECGDVCPAFVKPFTWALGSPPGIPAPAPESCDDWAFSAPLQVDAPRPVDQGTSAPFFRLVHFTITGTPGIPLVVYAIGSTRFDGNFVPGGWDDLGTSADGVVHGKRYQSLGNIPPNGILSVSWDVPVSQGVSYPSAPNFDLQGIGVFDITEDSAGDFGNHLWKLPQVDTRGMIGITSGPTRCAFYWGPKIASTTDDTDEPVGPLPAPPGGGGPGGTLDPPGNDPDDPGANEDDGNCEGFSFTDPTTWGGQATCMLVGLLGSIADGITNLVHAVVSLAADIASAILARLAALFVPSQSHLRTEVDDVQGAWDDTAPGEIVSTVTALPGYFDTPVSAGCDGPAMPIDFGMGSGSTTMHPLSTCSTGMARVASIVKLAMQVGVWLGAILLAFRILAGSLGYHVGIGKGGDE